MTDMPQSPFEPVETQPRVSAPSSLAPGPGLDPVIQERLVLEAKIKRGLGWFYWIAGLSIVNLTIMLTGSDSYFVVGLGAALFAHGVAIELGAPAIGVVVAGICSALFRLFGYLGMRGNRIAAIVGAVLYLGDAFIFLAISDWFSVAFHALALFGLFCGISALLKLHATGAFLPQMPGTQPEFAPLAEQTDEPINPYAD